MGDVTLTIAIWYKKDKNTEHVSVKEIIAADSSLRDFRDKVSEHLLNYEFSRSRKLEEWEMIDCTYHPPKLMQKDLKSYTEYSGPQSITLQKLGWFPSGKVILVPKDNIREIEDILANKNELVQFDYGELIKNESTLVNSHSLMLKDNKTGEFISEKQKPSEIMQSVTNRFENEDSIKNQTNDKKFSITARRTEEERCTKIDSLIKQLEEKSKKSKKNQKVNQKVRQMLMKSGAKGDKKIRQEDRIYLEVILIHDHDNSSNELQAYFFSKMNSIGKLSDTVTSKKVKISETIECMVNMSKLISDKVQIGMYYRLPNTMLLYEAREKGYIKDFDRVFVRIFSKENYEASPSISLYEEGQKKR